VGGTAPVAGDVAWFKVVKSTNPNLSASVSIAGLYFQSTGSSGYDITRTSTQTLTLTGTAPDTTGAETGNTNAVAIGANNTSGTNTIDVPIILGASSGSTQTFFQASGGTLVVNGVISGTIDTLALTGGGTGNFTFNGANTFNVTANGITIDGGTLKLGNATALGVTGNSITVGSNQTATLDLNGQSIANAVIIQGSGIGGSGALINSSATAATLSGTLDGSSTPTIGGTGNITISGQIIASGSSSLTKVGSNTVFFTNNTNNYTRPTNIVGGVLNIQAANALGSTSNGTTVQSGAALQIQGGITTAAEALTLNGTGISNDGALRNISSNNTYAGLVTLGSATRINSDSSTLTLSNAGTITGATFGLTVGGAGNTTINSIIGTTSGKLIKDGAGTLTLTAANTYTGLTEIDGGILNAGSLANGGTASAIGQSTNVAANLVFGGGTLQYTGSTARSTDRLFTIGDAAGNSATLDASGGSTGTLTLTNGGSIAFGNTSAHTLNLTGSNTGINTLAAIIGDNTGATSVTKSGGGTWVLSGSNTYTGGTTISAGLLQANNNTALGSVNGSLTVNGGVLDLNGKTVGVGNLTGSGGNIWNNATGTNITFTIGNGNGTGGNYAGVIADHNTGTGTVALTKTGTGTITLSGANTYTGATIINNGTLSLDNAGTTAARLANTASITVTSGGTLLLASSSGSSNDRINNAAKMFLNASGSSTVAFNTGGLSEHGATNNTAGIGALTLQSTSIIDMGNGSSIIAFANSNSVLGNSAAWSGTLKIYDWSGTPTTGGGTDQLFIGNDVTGLTATQLAEFQFYTGAGSGAYTAGAIILSNGEIVPTGVAVPEPSTWLAAALALGAVGYMQRRRLCKMLRR
jgi:autotransporter-associated beta strand protein